jgi:hypothetical protein
MEPLSADQIHSSAYEIHKLHGREPPPVSLLEGLPAVGGDTLLRTVETYVRATESRLVTLHHSLQQHRSGTRVSDVITGFFSAYLCEQAQQEALESVQLEKESVAQGGEPAESSSNPENEQSGFHNPTEQSSQPSAAFTQPRDDMSSTSNRTSLRGEFPSTFLFILFH